MECQRVNRLGANSASLVLVSAWNDSGGGFLTRLLDGHSRLRGWPFELLLGTHGYDDANAGLIHDRYRWPRFDLTADPRDWFEAIADSETKDVLTGIAPPRFAGYGLPVSLDAWRAAFLAWPKPTPPARRDIIAAYIDSWFSLCSDKPDSDRILAHCPSIILDGPAIFADFPHAKIVHVVRDPLAGLGDFRRRHAGFPADRFAARWTLVNGAALDAVARRPNAVSLVSYEKLRDDREAVLRNILTFLDLPFEPSVLHPCWRGQRLDTANLGPFGGVGQIGAPYDVTMCESIPHGDRVAILSATATVRAQVASQQLL